MRTAFHISEGMRAEKWAREIKEMEGKRGKGGYGKFEWRRLLF